MAGDWIKMRTDLFEDPAVFKLAALTGMDRLSIVGRLYAFWSWADKHSVDGRVDGGSSQVVDAVVQCDGFAESLVAVKWLEVDADCVRIPKHERHNGDPAKARSLKNQRQARWRERSRNGDVEASTASSTREEKRREDITPIVPTGDFEKFWNLWPANPRKASKGKCLELWRQKKLDQRAAQIVAHVEAMKGTDGWREGYIPAPMTYLRQQRWDGAEIAAASPERRVAL